MKIQVKGTIYLRILNLEDLQDYFAFIKSNRENLKLYFPITVADTDTVELAKEYLQGLVDLFEKKEYFPFGIFDNNKFIGFVSVKNLDWDADKAELGYSIDAHYEGKGISTLAIAKVIQFCFEEIDLNKLFCRISPDNLGSIRVVQKNNFILEGTLREDFKLQTGELIDVMYFGLLNK